MNLSREFTVEGVIECLFKPEETQTDSFQSGLGVELWHKGPLDVYLLGTSETDIDGKFSINFSTDESFVVEGKISDVFLKVYYKGILVTGDNPYLCDNGCSDKILIRTLGS